MNTALSVSRIQQCIYLVRGNQVMLDSDLAQLYGVPPKRMNEQVRRNAKNFPEDFMFQLIPSEYDSLRSQFATLKLGRGQHRKYLPLVYTEQGVAMLSSVLKNDRAIEVNIAIMRAFVQLRKQSAQSHDLLYQVNQLNEKVDQLERNNDLKLGLILKKIQQIIDNPSPFALPAPNQLEIASKTVLTEDPNEILSAYENPLLNKDKNTFLSKKSSAKVNTIVREVAIYFGLKSSDLRAVRRFRSVTLPRQVAIYLIRKHIRLGFKEIGKSFGRKDHSTSIYAFRKISVALENDATMKEAIETIESLILSSNK